jgi:uroporphyrin-3 C-methyltransferase
MLDKDKPTNNTSKSTDEKKILVVDNITNTPKPSKSEPSLSKPSLSKDNAAKSGKDKSSIKSSTQSTNKTSVKNSARTNTEAKQKISKLAILALLISGVAIAGSAGHFLWQQQKMAANTAEQKSQTTQTLQDNKQRVKQELSATFASQLQAQQQQLNAQLQQYTQQADSFNQNKIVQLSDKIALLEQSIQQREPSDWLIHEAEYLIRIAARTMWLEQDTKAAIGLLKEADDRLAELQQPKYLPIRALIHQDIEALGLMPSLDNQNAILSLMALNKQVSSLPLAGVDLSETISESKQENLELSDDINDWKSNLGKTWDKFFNDFIVVRRRTGNVEPLIAPEQQGKLKQSLSLKVQLAQWAASEQKAEIYQQTLNDTQVSLNQFFDMEDTASKNFYQAIEQAKQHLISYDYPSDLGSLNAIKQLMNQQAKLESKAKGINTGTTLKESNAELETKRESGAQEPNPKESNKSSDVGNKQNTTDEDSI